MIALHVARTEGARARPPTPHPNLLRLSLYINDNYCITHVFCKTSQDRSDCCNLSKTFSMCRHVFSDVVDHVLFVAGQPQKKPLRPIINTINSCVNQLPFLQAATNFHTAALNLTVGGQSAPIWERFPIIISGYVHPLGHSRLVKALHVSAIHRPWSCVRNWV